MNLPKLMSDPYGAILPEEQAKQAWYELATEVAMTLQVNIVAYNPSILVQREGYTEVWNIPVGLALEIRRLGRQVGSAMSFVYNVDREAHRRIMEETA